MEWQKQMQYVHKNHNKVYQHSGNTWEETSHVTEERSTGVVVRTAYVRTAAGYMKGTSRCIVRWSTYERVQRGTKGEN